MLRDNLLYIILGLVAVVLIGVTIGLQLALMSNQTDNVTTDTSNNSSSSSLTDRIATVLQSITPTATAALISTVQSTNTPTPTVIPVQEVPATPTAIPTVTPMPAASATVHVAAPVSLPTVQAIARLDQTGEQRLLNAENLTLASNDEVVVDLVKDDPFAIGFMGRGQYRLARSTLRTVRIQLNDGSVVSPAPDAVFDGSYPLSRVLYLYSTADILRTKPEVAAFIGCYLSNINDEVLEMGFFPARQTLAQDSLRTYNAILGNSELLASPICSPQDLAGTVEIAGSTTLAALTQRMMDLFTSQGYTGENHIDAADTNSGFERFCTQSRADIIHADRQITVDELIQCKAAGREPVAFAVGEDALAVVVSSENAFINIVTIPQLQSIFSNATHWSAIQPDWPSELIHRVVPDRRGDTFATFVAQLFEDTVVGASVPVALAPSATPTAEPTSTATAVLPTATEIPATATDSPEPTGTTTATPSPTATNTPLPPVDYVLGYVEGRRECTLATQVMATLMTRWGWAIRTVAVQDARELFERTAHDADPSEWFDLTMCYEDPNDRANFFDYASNVLLIGGGYAHTDNQLLYVMAHAGVPSTLEYEDHCIFDLMKDLTFGDASLEGTDAAQWIEQHADVVGGWESCAGRYRQSAN